jgi:hypothetical protein
MVGKAVSGLIVWTPPPGMLKLIVPPPIELASRIAWRNEPVPLSLVFITVKTKGVLGLFVSDEFPVTLASCSLVFRMRSMRTECVALSEVAKIEAKKIEPIDINTRVSAIRRAKACGEVFFFMVFLG